MPNLAYSNGFWSRIVMILNFNNQVIPLTERVINEEIALRKKIRDLGVGIGKMSSSNEKISKKSKKKEENELHECDTCNYILHLSLVRKSMVTFLIQ